MKISVLGLNHKSAPVDVREMLAFDSAETVGVLRRLKATYPHSEFAMLSTCNRLELYEATASHESAGPEELCRFLADFRGIIPDRFKTCLYLYEDEDAVEHLLAVASSLDSMVVGEAQIISQVKSAYRLAVTARSAGKILSRLFHMAFATGKRVHSSTNIAAGRVSVAGVAVELAGQLFADISRAVILVIGAGEMGQLIVKHLLHEGCRDMTVVNRSPEKAREISSEAGIKAAPWECLGEKLTASDIVISSAAAGDYLFGRDQLAGLLAGRRRGMLLVIDISVPRNFEPAVNEIDDVYLYSIDDLSVVAEQNRKAREADVARGMHMVRQGRIDFMEWFRHQDIGPLIGKMRDQFGLIAEAEMKQFFTGYRQEASCRPLLEMMVRRVVNKLVHCLIQNVNTVAHRHGSSEAASLLEAITRKAEEIKAGPSKDSMEEKGGAG
jgi:glutamyl-tRNA reductase